MPQPPPIYIISGLPRSGTSMLMGMLHAAGIPLLTDQLRQPDEDNPLGYFELEAVKSLRADSTWLADARGKAVKVIHALLRDLPPTNLYSILVMHRDLDEVLASQRKMLARSGRAGASLNPDTLKKVFTAQLEAARAWAASQPHCSCLDIHYRDVIADPLTQSSRIAAFINLPDRAQAMAAAVQSSLYRNRSEPSPPNTP